MCTSELFIVSNIYKYDVDLYYTDVMSAVKSNRRLRDTYEYIVVGNNRDNIIFNNY